MEFPPDNTTHIKMREIICVIKAFRLSVERYNLIRDTIQRYVLHFCITFSMWSFHDRQLLTVIPSSLAVEQDLITESWYGLSGLDCKN